MKMNPLFYISLGVILAGTLAMFISVSSQSDQISRLDERINELGDSVAAVDDAAGREVRALVEKVDGLDERVRQPSVEIARKTVIAYTSDQTPPDWWYDYPLFEVPAVPENATGFDVGEHLSCRTGYVPVVAWTELVVSHPGNVMYSAHASYTDTGSTLLYLRARQNGRGYAYIEVLLLCRVDGSAY